MSTLWRLLAESWPLAWPRPRVRQLVGAEALTALERSGVVRSSSLAPDDPFPCRCQAEAGCAMRIVEDGGLVAVCELSPAQCPDERLADDDALRSHVDPDTLGPVLQRALRVPVRPVVEHRSVLGLGERVVGAAEVRFVLVPRPGRWVEDGWLERAVDEDPDRVLVALVFERASLPASAPRRLRGTRVEWVALSEAFDPATGTLDLAALWLAVAPEAELGPELWPRYAFTADPDRGRFSYAGRPVPIDRSPFVERLLVELLRRAGEWVPRSFLIGTLWPDAHLEPKPPSNVQLERRLRQLKADLSAAFTALPPIPGAARDPIENRRLTDDAAGSYRIDVPRERVLWLSRPS